MSAGVNAIEVDAARTSFGYVGVWHLKSEESFNKNPFWISYRRVHELFRSARMDGILEGLHSLNDLLSRARGIKGVMIDVKDPGICCDVADAVRKSGFKGKIYLSIKSLDEVGDYRALMPEALILGSVDKAVELGVSLMRAYRLDGLSVRHKLISKELVDSIHKLNGLVAAWVVNSREEAQKLAKLGVDLIISDYPQKLQGPKNA